MQPLGKNEGRSSDGRLRRLFDWAICGYSRDAHGAVYTDGLRLGLNRRGKLVLWLLDAKRFWPWRVRMVLADACSRAAVRLRGQEVREFGHFGGVVGNRAAEVIDQLEFELILSRSGDEIAELRSLITELALLSGASWWRKTNRGAKTPS